ncbi:(5-formylfuran-3-yl)methyl phosphate synthase [Cupriavidus basilensis]|uniref:(5-formylfuran-3-yl)methyl phosphate synthase n=1 Tax=Cupriavidus basilensis TaxID=68895 RepID=UPI0020A65003|nr:(5-formylfuran-3-yl)methyl phosphate synthase [Cupriavidus basilensis]MCP3023933.1 (5-formylfuran-3-yl)methyl phosphate synthase [Cupriavidus basilensis]MDR3380526.1 (5-formylfuran-3-yl)methyl phosphate synthase [Cupriavidus basilensis]
MTSLLTSVRNVTEALQAAIAGADLIDLKEPRAGALGALPAQTVREVVGAVRARWPARLLSATIGDVAPAEHAVMMLMANTIGKCGVDYVKVGVAPGAHGREALRRLATLPWQVVPVFLADHGVDLKLVEEACEMGFPAVMADTAGKQAGSLFDCVDITTLAAMTRIARRRGVKVGLAGSLQLVHLPHLHALAPDFAGFRGALCDGGRAGHLDPAKVAALRAGLHPAAALEPQPA